MLFFTLKDVKEATWEGYLAGLAGVVAGLHREHAYLLDSDVLRPFERDAFTAILHGTAQWARLDLPNLEVYAELTGMVRRWMTAQVGGSTELQAFLQALLHGDARTIERYLSRMIKTSLSYHDTGGPEPERVIHGFIVGLLVGLGPDYDVRSNRESGYGRYDVMVLPRTPGRPGVVLELKTVDDDAGETPTAALEAALRQIRERDYATELRERGASPIVELAAAFTGKRAFVARADAPLTPSTR